MKLIIRHDRFATGGKYQILEKLTRTVAAICRSDRSVRKLYIGIASGPEPKAGLKRRYDKFKQGHGINEMILLYQSSSQAFCRDVEKYLEDYFQANHPNIINRRAGGGGRVSQQPYHFVYLAVQRVGNSDA